MKASKPRYRVEIRRGPFGLLRRVVESNFVDITGETLLIRRMAVAADGKSEMVDEYVLLRKIVRVVSRALLIPRDDEDDEDEVDEPQDFPDEPTRMPPADPHPRTEVAYR